jgi:hypothetical protein
VPGMLQIQQSMHSNSYFDNCLLTTAALLIIIITRMKPHNANKMR